MKILVLNAGSSSLKAALRQFGPGTLPAEAPLPLWEAHVEWGRQPGHAHVRARGMSGTVSESDLAAESPAEVVRPLIESLWSGPERMLAGPVDIAFVGHRVVHGGRVFRDPTPITPEVLSQVRKYAELAPEHNRLELEVMEAAIQVLGSETRHVAVFDTAFHSTLPLPARIYPGPYAWYEQGIVRYGFHGISHQYTARRAAEILGCEQDNLKLVTCHLGNGASLAAVQNGRSVDTTMGFTPLEGLMMGSRSGSIDPGILIYLVRHCGYSARELDVLLNEESGLKGVSGISGDMREILKAISDGSERARLAFDIYTHRLCREIGAMVASLGGVDALVFTAGVGENTPRLRAVVCERLRFLGIEIDLNRNVSATIDVDVAAPDSRVRVLVVHTNEEWEIARECHLLATKEL